MRNERGYCNNDHTEIIGIKEWCEQVYTNKLDKQDEMNK